jgi:hypothetical protein
MRLARKDAVGVALVLCTGAVVLIRNTASEHGFMVGAPRSTVFYDFNVVPADDAAVLRHQVVVVSGSTIERVEPVGGFALPNGARRIDGGGSGYMVAGRFGVLEPGGRADILLVERNPKDDFEALRRPTGVMVRGRWYGRAELDQVLAEVLASPLPDPSAPRGQGGAR